MISTVWIRRLRRTGTPVIGGLTSDRAIKLVRGLKDLNIVGMDVVEVAPAYDRPKYRSGGGDPALEMLYIRRRRRANNPVTPVPYGTGVNQAQAAGPATAVKAHRILGDTVHTEADRSSGKPRFEGGDNPAPFGFIRQPIAIITFGIYPKYFELPDKTASRFEQRCAGPVGRGPG